MKYSKIPLTLFLWLVLQQVLLAQPPTDLPANAVSRAELEALKAQVDEVEEQFSQKLEDMDDNSRNQFIAIILGYLFALGSGPLAVFLRSRLDRKHLDAKASEVAIAEMERNFPTIAERYIQAYLDKEVPSRVQALINAGEAHASEAKLRSTTSILVVADDDTLAQARAQHLRKLGFLDVRTALPDSYSQLGMEKIIFVEHPGYEDSYKNLDNRYLQDLIQLVGTSPDKGMFFFIPFYNQRLDFSLLKQKSFANSEAQISGNLMKLIQQLPEVQIQRDDSHAHP